MILIFLFLKISGNVMRGKLWFWIVIWAKFLSFFSLFLQITSEFRIKQWRAFYSSVLWTCLLLTIIIIIDYVKKFFFSFSLYENDCMKMNIFILLNIVFSTSGAYVCKNYYEFSVRFVNVTETRIWIDFFSRSYFICCWLY